MLSSLSQRVILPTQVFLLLISNTFAVEKIATPLEILQQRDPLSCVLPHNSQSELCDGAAGAYQVARLALAVESSAKALELAGIGFDSRDVQAMIYRDGFDSGFDLALISPTAALIDVASLGKSGPLGSNAKNIKSLATSSLEALYPGIVKTLGYKNIEALDGVIPTGGFADFSSLADIIDRSENSRVSSIGYESFLPARHVSLAESQSFPLLRLIPGPNRNQRGQFIGQSPRDFLFARTEKSSMPEMRSDGPWSDLPVTLGFSDSLIMESLHKEGRRGVSQSLQESPFSGAGCWNCKQPPELENGITSVFGKEEFASNLVDNKSANLPNGNGGQLFNHSPNAKGLRANSEGGNSDTTKESFTGTVSCILTCAKNSKKIKDGAKEFGIGTAKGVAGSAIAYVAAKLPKGGKTTGGLLWVAAELLESGTKQVKGGSEKFTDGVVACLDDKKDCKKEEPKKEEPKKEEPKKEEPKKEEPKKVTKTSLTPSPGSDHAEKNTPVPKNRSQENTKIIREGTKCGWKPTPNGEGITCKDIDYRHTPNMVCATNKLGEVHCATDPGENLASITIEGPIYVINKSKLLKLEGAKDGLLAGDIAQAAILASIDPNNFSLDNFKPIRNQEAFTPLANEILKNQPPAFFKGGFSSQLDLNNRRDLGVSSIERDNSDLMIEDNNIQLGDEVIDGMRTTPEYNLQ